MTAALSAIIPFFGIVLIGFIAARRRIVSETGLAGLNGFIFNIALPPLLFRVMSGAPDQGAGQGAGDGDVWAFILAYGLPTIAIYLFGLVLARGLFGLRSSSATLFAHLSANGNVGFLGIPLAIAILGPEGALPIALALTFDILVVMTITALLLEMSAAQSMRAAGPMAALRAALLNPIALAALGGVAWGFIGRQTFGLSLPEPAIVLLDTLGQAAPPAALFAVGATLAFKQADRRIGEIGVITLLKLIAHPLAVGVSIAALAPETPAIWAAGAVLAAACPCSNNAVIFAGTYGAYEARASASVLISTALAILTFAFFVAKSA